MSDRQHDECVSKGLASFFWIGPFNQNFTTENEKSLALKYSTKYSSEDTGISNTHILDKMGVNLSFFSKFL